MAEPTEKTLERFRHMVELVTKPRKLIPAHQKQVRVFRPEEKFTAVLRYMDEKDFSQVVALRGEEHVLLTAEGIAEWLNTRVKEGMLDLGKYSVGDVLQFEKGEKSAVMARNQTVDEALDLFSQTALNRRSARIFAVIITQNGRRTEKPLGLVTPWDLLKERDEG